MPNIYVLYKRYEVPPEQMEDVRKLVPVVAVYSSPQAIFTTLESAQKELDMLQSRAGQGIIWAMVRYTNMGGGLKLTRTSMPYSTTNRLADDPDYPDEFATPRINF